MIKNLTSIAGALWAVAAWPDRLVAVLMIFLIPADFLASQWSLLGANLLVAGYLGQLLWKRAFG